MSEIIAKYGTQKGSKAEYKDSLTWYEFASVSKTAKANPNDEMAVNNALLKLAVIKITNAAGQVFSEPLTVMKAFEEWDARDAIRVVKALTKLVQEDDDPKET